MPRGQALFLEPGLAETDTKGYPDTMRVSWQACDGYHRSSTLLEMKMQLWIGDGREYCTKYQTAPESSADGCVEAQQG